MDFADCYRHDLRQQRRRAARHFKERAEARCQWQTHRYGSSEPASECRRIDVVTGEVVEIVKPDERPGQGRRKSPR